MESFLSTSYENTVLIAAAYAATLPKGSVIALRGGLGVGKTAFVTGFAKGLGIECDVTSPTFAIVNEYHGTDASLYHFDMYRIETWEDLESTGFFDQLDTDAYLCIEWSENIEGALPPSTIYVSISTLDETTRQIQIEPREACT